MTSDPLANTSHKRLWLALHIKFEQHLYELISQSNMISRGRSQTCYMQTACLRAHWPIVACTVVLLTLQPDHNAESAAKLATNHLDSRCQLHQHAGLVTSPTSRWWLLMVCVH